jgi:hypothetical protein
MRKSMVVIAIAAGCGEPRPAGPTQPPAIDAVAAACTPTGASSLAGVTIDFPSPRCTFTLAEAAAGLAIPYRVVVASPVAQVVPAPLDAGGCGQPDASGLIVAGSIGGGTQRYCVCDTGLCPAPDQTPHAVPAGTYPATFTWTGENWSGPSDTNNPKGPPFPPGDYTLLVTTHGTHAGAAFEVTGALPIHLTP